MITSVTLNPCNDWTLTIPSFVYGGMNRVQSDELFLAGKGFNLAKVVVRLGEPACATGLLYDENGLPTQKMLESEGVAVDCVWSPGKIRTNIKLFDAEKRAVTEINQKGVPVTPDLLTRIKEKIQAWAKKSDMLVLTGSLPPDCPQNFYRILTELAHPYCKVAVDAEGEKLSQAIEAKPFLIKPNLFELESVAGRKLAGLNEIRQAARDIVKRGVGIVAVSMGNEGALICDTGESWYAPPLDVEVKGTVGAGDSMLAGLCVAYLKGCTLKEMLRFGVAAATDSVTRPGTELCRDEGVARTLERVEVRPL